MNRHETTVSLYSDTTGEIMGKLQLKINYEYFPPLSATQVCPDDPAEVTIISTQVNTISDGWIGASFLDLILDEKFWDEIKQEIIDLEG